MPLTPSAATEERLRSVAARRGQAPEAALDALLDQALAEQEAPDALPGVIPAGVDPLSVPQRSPIRRTHTPEGRARAIAALRELCEADDEDEPPRAGETPECAPVAEPITFRRWNIETGERIDEDAALAEA